VKDNVFSILILHFLNSKKLNGHRSIEINSTLSLKQTKYKRTSLKRKFIFMQHLKNASSYKSISHEPSQHAVSLLTGSDLPFWYLHSMSLTNKAGIHSNPRIQVQTTLEIEAHINPLKRLFTLQEWLHIQHHR
jgi:hypothetical protein